MHHSGVEQPGHQVGVTWAAVSWEDLAVRWGDGDIYHWWHYWILHAEQRWAVGVSDTVLEKKAGWKKQSDELKSVYQYSEWHNILVWKAWLAKCLISNVCDRCMSRRRPMTFKCTNCLFFHLYSTENFSGFQTKPNSCLKENSFDCSHSSQIDCHGIKQTYADLYLWMHFRYFVNLVVYIVFNKLQ